MSRMKSMKRPAAMFDKAAGGNVISNVKLKDNVCQDKCFKEKKLCRVCSTRRKTKHNSMLQPILGVLLEIRAELEKSIVEQNYRQNIGHTVEIVKAC